MVFNMEISLQQEDDYSQCYWVDDFSSMIEEFFEEAHVTPRFPQPGKSRVTPRALARAGITTKRKTQ